VSVKGKSLLPHPIPMEGIPTLTIRLEKIGLKDAQQFIDPFIAVSVKGKSLLPHPLGKYILVLVCFLFNKYQLHATRAKYTYN